MEQANVLYSLLENRYSKKVFQRTLGLLRSQYIWRLTIGKMIADTWNSILYPKDLWNPPATQRTTKTWLGNCKRRQTEAGGEEH